MPLTVDEFCERLRSSYLIAESELQEWIDSLPVDNRPTTGEALAYAVIKHEKLTRLQAEQIYSGHGRSLVMGNYVILDKLGQCGMGMVLKAQHQRMKRVVALNVVSVSHRNLRRATAIPHRLDKTERPASLGWRQPG